MYIVQMYKCTCACTYKCMSYFSPYWGLAEKVLLSSSHAHCMFGIHYMWYRLHTPCVHVHVSDPSLQLLSLPHPLIPPLPFREKKGWLLCNIRITKSLITVMYNVRVHCTRKFIFHNNTKFRGIPPSACSGTSNLHTNCNGRAIKVPSLELRTRGIQYTTWKFQSMCMCILTPIDN